MKINLDTILLGIDGKPLKSGTEENAENLTFRRAAANGLLSEVEQADAQNKYRRYELAVRLSDAAVVELNISIEDASLIKYAVGKAFPALIVGRVYDIIDPPSDK